MKIKEERIEEALKDLDWISDWFYCEMPDPEEYLRMAGIIIDIKKLIKELGGLE